MKARYIILVVVFGSLLWLCNGPNRDRALDRAQERLEPAINGLQQYHAQHQRFPNTLDDLVATGMLSALPDIPKVRGTIGSGSFRYEVSEDGARFYLDAAYIFPSGMGHADAVARWFRSDSHEWGTSKYPPSLGSERKIKNREESAKREHPNA